MALTLLKGVIVLAIVTGTLAGPVRYNDDLDRTTECARTCDLSVDARYPAGQTFEYEYASDLVTSIPGATEQESKLQLQAQVQLEVLSPCEMALQLSDVGLRDGQQFVDQALDFKRSLQEKPLRFAWQDGAVEAVCPDAEEPAWVVNVKRGIISHFQHTMSRTASNTRVRETDINGDCEVNYEIVKSGWGSSKTVKKTVDLIGCVGRQSFDTMLQATSYRVPSSIQSLPLLKSSLECEQTLAGEGHVTTVSCQEAHIFRPFSKDTSGAMTTVSSKLTHKKTVPSTRTTQEVITKRAPLTFEDVAGPDEQEQRRREVKLTLTEMCDETKEDIRPETPSKFHTLLKQLRKLDEENLKFIHSMVTRGTMCDKAGKFFRDAIPNLGSAASVTFIRDLVIDEDVKDTELDVWMTSLAFISKPNLQMLEAVKPLLERLEPNRKIALAVSTLVHGYCRQNAECGDESVVKEIAKIFTDNLQGGCKTSDEKQYDKVMMSLKALGNMGHAKDAASALAQCISKKDNSMELRVAAVSAFRRMACITEKDDLMRVFEDAEEDAELRIAAYLTLMHCPTEALLGRIRRALENEKVNQVGSFVWTHLTNLAESSCPLKQEVNSILQSSELKKEFDLDKRKFSRNIEWSMFSELLNTGAVMDSNIIWSAKSFIPRSANLNLTVDVFGESVNLIELGGRAEGLDGLLERFFDKEDNSVERPKRDVISPNALKPLDKKFTAPNRDNPQGSYYIRIFGNEIRYDEFRGFDLESLKEKFNFLDWLIDLSREHNFDFTKSMSLMDTTMTIPTMTGLPLKLSVDGSAVVDVKVKGKLDLRNLGAAPRSVDIQGTIAPSAALEITGEMGVDAFVAHTGLRRTTTLHTSTLADGKIELKEGKIFNMDINMPRDKIELLDAKTKFFIHIRGQDVEQKMPSIPRISSSKCMGGKFTKATGLELCASGTMPSFKNEYWWMPFFGPMEANLVVNKRDTFSGVHLEAKILQDRMKRESGLEITDILKLSYNTPGSQYDREFTVDFTLNRDQKALRLNLKTPWKKADLSGSLVNQKDLKRFSARAIMDDENEYAFTAELQIEPNKFNTRYVPVVELNIPRRTLARLDGEVTYRPNKLIDIDLNLKEVTKAPMTVKGGITLKNKGLRHDVDLDVKVPHFMGDINGFLDRTTGVTGHVQVKYQIDNGETQIFTLDKKWNKSVNGDLSEYSFNGGFSTTRWPEYDSDMQMTFSKTSGKSGRSMSMSFEGGIGGVPAKRLTLTASAADNSKFKKKAYEGFLRFTLPVKNIAYEFSAEHMHTPSELKSTSTVKYDTRKEAVFNLNLNKESTSPLKLMADASLHYPGRKFSFVERLEEKAPKEYHHDLEITLDKYSKVTLTSLYKMEPRHELTATLNLPDMQPIVIEGHLNPEWRNAQSKAIVQYESEKWGGEANWMVNGGAKGCNLIAGIDIIYPGRHIKAETEATRNGANLNGRMEALWDAEHDTSKKIDISGAVTLNKATPALEMKVTWPRDFVQITASGKYDKKGYWAVERDLEGKIKIKSSLSRLSNVGLAFSHVQTDAIIKTHAETTWAPEKKIEGDFVLNKKMGYSNFVTSLKMTTPFRGFHTIETKLDYDLQGSSLTTNAEAKWEAKEMTFAATGTANLKEHNINGNIVFTSPFYGYERANMIVSHEDDGQVYKSLMTASLGSKKVGIVFNMDHDRQNWHITNSGDLTVTLPIPDYETHSLNWNHQNDADSIKCRIELNCVNGRSLIELDGNHKNNRNKRAIDITASLSTPFRMARDMRFNFNHQHAKNSWENIKTSAMAQWAPGKAIQLENVASYELGVSVTKNLKITTPFRGYELITVDIDNRVNAYGYTTHKEIKWGANKKVTIDGSYTRNGYIIDSELRFTSPWPVAERLVFLASNKKEQDLWVTSSSVDYATNKKIELTTKFGFAALKKFYIDLKSPCPYFKTLFMDIEHTGSLKDFTTKAEFQQLPYVEPITGTVKVDIANIKNVKASVDIETPFHVIRFIRALVSNKKAGRTGYKTEVSFEIPQHKLTASHDLMTASLREYKCHSEIEYNMEKGMLDVAWALEPKISVNVHVTTPFETLRTGSIALNHDGSYDNFQNDAAVEWNSKKIVGNSAFRLSGTQVTANAEVKTPFAGIRDMTVELKHKGGLKDFDNELSFMWESKKIVGNTEFSFDGKQVVAKATMKTPFEKLRNMAMELKHTGELKNFNNEATIEWNNKKIAGESNFNLRGTELYAKTILLTPFNKLRRLEAEVKHTGEFRQFNNEATIKLNNKHISLSSEAVFKGNKINGKMEINHSFDDGFFPSEVMLAFDHQGRIKDFKNSAILEWGSHRMGASSEFSLKGANMKGSVTIQKPEEYSVIVNHQGDWENFENSLIVRMDNKEIRGESMYKFDGNMLEASVKLRTPYKSFKSMTADLTHEGSLNNFKSSAKITTPFEMISMASADISHNGNYYNHENSFSIDVDGKRIVGNSRYNNAGDEIDGSADIELPSDYGKYGYTLNHKGNMEDFTTTAGIETPFTNFRRSSININHRGTLRNFDSSARLETSYPSMENFAASAKHVKNRQGFKSSAVIETPFQGYRKMEAGIAHRGGWKDFTTSANVDTSIRGYEKFAAVVSHNSGDNHFTTSGSVETPFAGHEKHEVAFSHNGDRKEFATNGNVKTSLAGHEQFGFNINHKADENGMESSASVEMPYRGYERFMGSLRQTGGLNNFRAVAAIETPVAGYERFGAEFSHNGDMNAFDTTGKVTTPFRGYGEFSGALKHKGTLKDFETSANVETPIRGYKKISGVVKHKGSLKDFESSANVETSTERISGTLQHQGGLKNFKTVGNVETTIQGYRKFAFNVDHDMNRGIANSGSIETPFRGYDQFDWDLNHRGNNKGFSTNVKLNSPISGYERFGLNIKHLGKNLKEFTTTIKAKSPIAGFETFGARIDHQGTFHDFKSNAKIETPFTSLSTINLDISHKGDINNFNNAGSIEWDGKKIEASSAMKTTGGWWEHDHTGTLSLKTPFKTLRNLEVKVEHNGESGAWNGKAVATMNGKTYVDADYAVNTGNRKTLDINAREPRPMALNVDADQKGVTAALNWDPSRTDTSIRVEAGLKNEALEKELKAKIMLPTRTVGVLASLDKSGDKWNHKAEVQWDAAPKKKLGYEVALSYNTRGHQNMYDGMIKLDSPRIDFEITGSHVLTPGRRYVTEVALQTKERLVIKNELTTDWPSFRHQISISHPRFTRDAVVKTDGTVDLDKMVLDGKINVQYEDESIDFSGKVADESNGKNKNYVTKMTLHHPNSQTDFTHTLNIQSNKEISVFQTEVNFLSASDRAMKTAAVRAEINKLRDALKFEWINPLVGDIKVSGRKTQADMKQGIYRFELEGEYSGRSAHVEVAVDRTQPSAEVKLTDDRDNVMHIMGRYVDANRISLDAYHIKNGEKTEDGQLSVRLSDGRLIVARAYLRPEIVDDIKGMRYETEGVSWNRVRRSVAEEWDMRKNHLRQALHPIRDAAYSVHEDLSGTWKLISADFSRMYRNNEFYIATIYDNTVMASQQMKAAIEAKWEAAKNYLMELKNRFVMWQEQMAARIEQFKNDLHQAIGMTLAGIQIYFNDEAALLREKIQAKYDAMIDWMATASPWLNDVWKTSGDKYYALKQAVCDWAKEKMENVKAHPNIQKIVAHATETGALLNRWKNTLSGHMDRMTEKYNMMINTAKNTWQDVQRHPHVKSAVNMAKSAWQDSQWAVKYMELEDKAQKAWDWVKHQSWDTAKENAMQWTKQYLQLDKTRATVWDPQRGEFQVEIYLPFSLKDLKTLPKIEYKAYIVRARNLIKRFMPETSNLWDMYYTYRPSSDYTNWLPPFKAHAVVAGRQHYMTFDKKFYEFEGQCSYLLARDFIKGKFAVIVNYEQGPSTRKSITVFAGEKQVEILPGYKVLLDGQRVEMPQHFDMTTILREGNTVVVKNTHGIEVTCDLPRDRCTVEVSGWYFGKTDGLFGTYNNEPSDDLMRSPEEVADDWSVGQCRTVNNAAVVSADPDSHRYRLCARYFKEESSVFRPCFKQVNPAAYMQMCLNDLPSTLNRLETDEDVCDMAALYVDECRRAEVGVRVPSICVSCELPDGSLQGMGQDRVLDIEKDPKAVPQSVDIVLVVSHGLCNKDLGPDLPDLVSSIEKSFREVGLKNNRYALVGYGGRSIAEPHVHTMQGQIFNDQTKFSVAVDNFHFEDSKNEDSLAALQYVSTALHFRPAVAKVVLLVPCMRCEEKTALYSEVQELMLRRDIALHVLMEHNFMIRAKSPKTSFIFGVDSESMFTEKDVGKLEGDTELRNFVITPKDICVALSEETDGSVFNALKMKTGKTAVQKKFRDVFSAVIAEKGEPAECQICDCVADNIGMGKSVCRPCVIRSPIYKYLPTFDDEDEDDDADEDDDDDEATDTAEKPKNEIKVKPPKNPTIRNKKVMKTRKGKNFRSRNVNPKRKARMFNKKQA